MSKARQLGRYRLNAYLRHLKTWSVYYTPARKNTPTELALWRALHRALDRLRPFLNQAHG